MTRACEKRKEEIDNLKIDHKIRCAKAATFLGTLIDPETLEMKEDLKSRFCAGYLECRAIKRKYSRRSSDAKYKARKKGVTFIQAAAEMFDRSAEFKTKARWKICKR